MTTGFFARTVFCLTLALPAVAAMPAMAQLDEMKPMASATPNPITAEDGPTKTTAMTVAMLYHRLIGRAPDYSAWAQQTEEYKAAPDLQKSVVQEQQVSNYKSIFTLTTLAEPVIVQTDVVISEYSPKNGGFSIDGFRDDSYFGYSFGGKNYAVIVPDLANHQWQPVEIDQAGVIDLAAQRHNRVLTVTLYITPDFADSRMPMEIDGKSYWLISGDLQRLTLSEPGKTKTLLERSIGTRDATPGTNSELLNLYQNQR